MSKNKQLSTSFANTPEIIKNTPSKTETFAGKHTARVTHTYDQPDGSQVKATRKINKDGSISDKLAHRHK